MNLPTWLTPSHFVILGMLFGFAVVHSGGAALRHRTEKYIGARLYRILFASLSLPLALLTIVYFFNHRYDGLQLWQVQGVAGVKQQCGHFLRFLFSFCILLPSIY